MIGEMNKYFFSRWRINGGKFLSLATDVQNNLVLKFTILVHHSAQHTNYHK